jgi:cytochrome b6-f complex iron-sulfur subunit
MNDKQLHKSGVNRRQFLGVAWAASLVGLFGQAGASLFQFLKPRIEPGTFGDKVVAGQLDEFAPGTIRHISKGRFYVARLEDGGLIALWQRCTHLGCTIPWRENEGRFLCPCHSSIFNPVGEVISGPAPRPMDLFPIELVEGQVVVDTGQVIERQAFDPAQAVYPS